MEILQEVLNRAGIQEVDWDLVLIGDGSGTGWEDAAGWAGVLIDKETRGRRLMYGAMNKGSVNLAELMPYVQSLAWYHSQFGESALKRKGMLRVHVITDSQVTAQHGIQSCRPGEPLPNVPQRTLWAAVREMTRIGYVIQWHWAARSTSGLNYLSDLVAGLSRRSVMGVEVGGMYAEAVRAAKALDQLSFADPLTGEPISPYGINPDEPSIPQAP